MLIAGCEMVMSEHREKEWREVIAAIRECYDGTVSYNTDKYQEDRVKWWDCVDVISSSGYYPIQDWEQELDRIEAVVKAYHKQDVCPEQDQNTFRITGGLKESYG